MLVPHPRMNNAPVVGFERDAGSRTTVRLTYPEGAPHSPSEYQETAVVALVVFKSLDLAWLTSVVTKQPLVSPPPPGRPETRGERWVHRVPVVTRASGPECGSGGRWWTRSL